MFLVTNPANPCLLLFQVISLKVLLTTLRGRSGHVSSRWVRHSPCNGLDFLTVGSGRWCLQHFDVVQAWHPYLHGNGSWSRPLDMYPVTLLVRSYLLRWIVIANMYSSQVSHLDWCVAFGMCPCSRLTPTARLRPREDVRPYHQWPHPPTPRT